MRTESLAGAGIAWVATGGRPRPWGVSARRVA